MARWKIKKDETEMYFSGCNQMKVFCQSAEKAFVTRILIIIKFLLVRLSSHQALRIIMIWNHGQKVNYHDHGGGDYVI